MCRGTRILFAKAEEMKKILHIPHKNSYVEYISRYSSTKRKNSNLPPRKLCIIVSPGPLHGCYLCMMRPFEVVKVKDTPKAVVLIFGWLGAPLRHLNKYAQIYNSKGCSTVTGVADSLSIMVTNKKQLRSYAQIAAQEVAILIRETGSKLPILVHVFSNGGTILLEQLEVMICEGSDPNIVLCGQCMKLGGQVFDSSPCYMHLCSGLKAIRTASPNCCVTWLIVSIFLTYATFNTLLTTLLRTSNRPNEFWTHLTKTDLATRQVYIYSPADELCDYIKLEELIQVRREMGVQVMVHRFLHSGHVQHLRMYPEDYMRLMDKILASIDTGSSQ